MGGHAPFWTRATARVNAVVWWMPLPRRVKAALSRVVYRNPPMPAAQVMAALDGLENAGVEVIVMGGWGIDALVGEQRRVHRDLDLVVDHREVDRALGTLRALGYEEWFRHTSPAPLGDFELLGDNVVVRDRLMRVVDLHPLRLDDPELAPANGAIGKRRVPCISARQQIRAHSDVETRWSRGQRRLRENLRTAQAALDREPAGSAEARQ